MTRRTWYESPDFFDLEDGMWDLEIEFAENAVAIVYLIDF
jgi:hypothetical protein